MKASLPPLLPSVSLFVILRLFSACTGGVVWFFAEQLVRGIVPQQLGYGSQEKGAAVGGAVVPVFAEHISRGIVPQQLGYGSQEKPIGFEVETEDVPPLQR